jgi:hypothetical protein
MLLFFMRLPACRTETRQRRGETAEPTQEINPVRYKRRHLRAESAQVRSTCSNPTAASSPAANLTVARVCDAAILGVYILAL